MLPAVAFGCLIGAATGAWVGYRAGQVHAIPTRLAPVVIEKTCPSCGPFYPF
jgi:hypothetical protein